MMKIQISINGGEIITLHVTRKERIPQDGNVLLYNYEVLGAFVNANGRLFGVHFFLEHYYAEGAEKLTQKVINQLNEKIEKNFWKNPGMAITKEERI